MFCYRIYSWLHIVMGEGIIITTYGTPAFVHLQLESVKRFAPCAKVLVYDDCSGDKRLKELAELYEAEYISTETKQGHYIGDLKSYEYGLNWASNNRFKYLTKISRRFLPITCWTDIPEGTTIGSPDIAFKWKLRTEFISFNVLAWKGFKAPNEIKGFVEDYMYNEAKQRGDITWFSWLGNSRAFNNDNFLWYNFAKPADYLAKAIEWGITGYTEIDFNTQAHLE